MHDSGASEGGLGLRRRCQAVTRGRCEVLPRPSSGAAPWSFLVYDTTDANGVDIGLKVKSAPAPEGAQVGSARSRSLVLAECYVMNQYDPGRGSDVDVGPKWLRIHWPVNIPGREYASPHPVTRTGHTSTPDMPFRSTTTATYRHAPNLMGRRRSRRLATGGAGHVLPSLSVPGADPGPEARAGRRSPSYTAAEVCPRLPVSIFGHRLGHELLSTPTGAARSATCSACSDQASWTWMRQRSD